MQEEKIGICITGSKEEHIEKIRSIFTVEEVLMIISLALKFNSSDPKYMLKETPKHISDLAEISIAGVIVKLAVAIPKESLEMIKKSSKIDLSDAVNKWDQLDPSPAPGVH